jgi:hypothetical protein
VGALELEAVVATAVGLGVGAAVTLAALAGAGHDPAGGPLAIPAGQAALVLGGAGALGLLGMLVPAALAGQTCLGAASSRMC